MLLHEHKIEVIRKARYFTRGEISESIKNVWFLIHGYGQLAEEFLGNFEIIDPVKNFLVAPEALSRFYVSAKKGTVGASWMTKEDRDSEINDYLAYLDSVYNSIIPHFGGSPVKINLLGFSQGSATAGRWALISKAHFDNLIFWAGDLPDEDQISENTGYLKTKKFFTVIGNGDNIINKDRFKAQSAAFSKFGLNHSSLTFDGGHEINRDCLVEIINCI